MSVGGICGSDLHLFAHNTGPSPTLMGMAGAFPFVLGHEIAGRVVEAGPQCPVDVGTRVAIDPCIPCAARGIDPPCANCARGWTSSCLNLDSRILTTGGRSLGFTRDLGGGWAEQVLAHTSMLHPLPDAVPDRAASLHEPVSIACHGILRAPPNDGDPVLVVGAGIIGLAAIAVTARACSPRRRSPCSRAIRIKPTRPRRAAPIKWCAARTRAAHFEELAQTQRCARRRPQGAT